MPRQLLATAALLFTLALCGAARADTYQLVTLDYPPYEYLENGQVKGAATDVVREAFARMGHEVKIEVLPWARALAMVKNNAADAVYTTFMTPEREEYLHYSKIVLMDQVTSLFVRKDSPIDYTGDLGALKDLTFGVVLGVSYGEKFDSAVKSGTLRNLDKASDGEENMRKLLLGRFDILASNRLGAWDILNKMGRRAEARELKPPLQSVPSYVGFSKSRGLEGLRDQFDDILREMKRDGSYTKIVNNYFFGDNEQASLQQVPITKPE